MAAWADTWRIEMTCAFPGLRRLLVVVVDCCKQALNKEQCLNVVDVSSVYSTDSPACVMSHDQLRRTLTATLTDCKNSRMTTSSRCISRATYVLHHLRIRTRISFVLSTANQSIHSFNQSINQSINQISPLTSRAGCLQETRN